MNFFFSINGQFFPPEVGQFFDPTVGRVWLSGGSVVAAGRAGLGEGEGERAEAGAPGTFRFRHHFVSSAWVTSDLPVPFSNLSIFLSSCFHSCFCNMPAECHILYFVLHSSSREMQRFSKDYKLVRPDHFQGDVSAIFQLFLLLISFPRGHWKYQD